MTTNPNRPNPPAPNPTWTQEDTTTPAEERGERVETGRHIARGGKEEGPVPGATGDRAADSRGR
jgi:hypothetical protein